MVAAIATEGRPVRTWFGKGKEGKAPEESQEHGGQQELFLNLKKLISKTVD